MPLRSITLHRTQAHHTLLDIGVGWGGLAIPARPRPSAATSSASRGRASRRRSPRSASRSAGSATSSASRCGVTATTRPCHPRGEERVMCVSLVTPALRRRPRLRAAPRWHRVAKSASHTRHAAFELCDYRDFARRPENAGAFDRIVSCEMIEAVGHEFLGAFSQLP